MALCALNDGKVFQRLSATRNRCQSSAFALSFDFFNLPEANCTVGHGTESSVFLGFVLPKKLVKRAVDRNQIKRWVREAFRGQMVRGSCAVVIRAKAKLLFKDRHDRLSARDDLSRLIKHWSDRVTDALGRIDR
ncbi:MAG: Ribonuclease [Pseudomonadota bacterium]|jgi:ribonuclease P protein component